MISKILSVLTGDVAKELSKAFADYHNAQTEQQRIEAEVRIKQLQDRQQNRALGGKMTSIVQAIWAAPFIIYTWKLVVWDKVLGLGATDGLSLQLTDMQMRIITLYFGGAIGVGVIRALRK